MTAQWFHPNLPTSWKKTQSPIVRYQRLMALSDESLAPAARYTQIAQKCGSLAEFSNDPETRVKARADAQVFYRKAKAAANPAEPPQPRTNIGKCFGWSPTQSAVRRLHTLVEYTDPRLAWSVRYLQASQDVQALADRSTDPDTKEKAQEDAWALARLARGAKRRE